MSKSSLPPKPPSDGTWLAEGQTTQFTRDTPASLLTMLDEIGDTQLQVRIMSDQALGGVMITGDTVFSSHADLIVFLKSVCQRYWESKGSYDQQE